MCVCVHVLLACLSVQFVFMTNSLCFLQWAMCSTGEMVHKRMEYDYNKNSISPVDSVQGIHHSSAVLEPIGGSNLTTHIGLLPHGAGVTDGEGAGNQPVARHVTKLLVSEGMLALGAAARALSADAVRSGTSGHQDALWVQAGDATCVTVKSAHLVDSSSCVNS